MAIYKIKHITEYQYTNSVYDSINQIMLYPIKDVYQKTKQVSIKVSGNPLISTFKDKFGNQLGIFSFLDPHQILNITSCIEVETCVVTEPVIKLSITEQWEDLAKTDQDPLIKDFLEMDEFDCQSEIENLVNSIYNPIKSPLDNAKLFSKYIFENFTYSKGITSVETSIDEIWKIKAGVCQDFAHFLLIMLRSVQIPARYVSGYICPLEDELRGVGATHAWIEIYLPTYGWIGLDPTNDCIASENHVRLAIGRYFKDCTPVKGLFKGNPEHQLSVSVIVENSETSNKTVYDNFFKNAMPDNPTFVRFSDEDPESNNSYQLHLNMQQQQQ